MDKVQWMETHVLTRGLDYKSTSIPSPTGAVVGSVDASAIGCSLPAPAVTLTSSETMRLRTFSFVQAVVPRRNL